MSEPLTSEQVAIIIRARRLLKEKGFAPDTDVKTLCRQVGVSRKTGYQWEKRLDGGFQQTPGLREDFERLKAEHERLKQAFADMRWENQGRKIAWEIHDVDALLAEKKSTMAKAPKKKR